MQKAITIALDANHLLNNADDDYGVGEIDGLNSFFTLGWWLEEWKILYTDSTTGKILLWVLLNDDESGFDWDEDDDEDLN